MRTFIIIFEICYFCLGCNKPDKLKNVFITPTVETSSDTLFLKWNFKNATDNDLIIPTLFTFRRLDGEDSNTYRNKENDLIDIGKILIVPYIYLKQIPDFKEDTLLHSKARNIDFLYSSWAKDVGVYDYIKNFDKCPQLIFLRAKSEKQLIFMFKPEVKGRYMIGFETKKSIDRTSLRVIGDSIVKRGVPLLQEIIGNRVEGYTFDYGEFRLDSIEVNL
ncbi:hypothetical protein CLV98_1452 [Dyadobacter jejuensis]|uniref:Uncharacterized protein n=1 Tax=Dyadobacter jejuensis TaxID=1082580 RepID=A0A315ZX73_9BACT|nr:hypothetical protein [Dyadobacter jejuensis]PWJ49832.1 hypothetical protein CLV98_1452 [Dyadobacter jejuensis]